MGWFQRLVEEALGVADQPPPQRQLDQPNQIAYFDPRESGYEAGHQLHQAIEQMQRQEQGLRRVRAAQRERHYINNNEYIETETFIEIEEGHIYNERGY